DQEPNTDYSFGAVSSNVPTKYKTLSAPFVLPSALDSGVAVLLTLAGGRDRE
ncbi:hypothetical protein BHM03_00016526, partial [Ensete ventricosum]